MRHQRCKVCGHRDKFNFNVPDETWARIVPRQFVNRVVCLACFDDFAAQGQEPYSLTSLYFAGDQAVMEFETAIASPPTWE